MVGKSNRDISHDIPNHGLDQGAVAGHDFLYISHPYVGLGIGHAAADIHAHRVGYDHALGGNDASYGHSHACMGIRHQADPFMKERKP